MVYDPELAKRVHQLVARRRHFSEKRMFGGIGYLFRNHLVLAVWTDLLIVRVGAERYRAALREPHVREFDVTGRAMTGWVVVAPGGVGTESELRSWLERALDFAATLPEKPDGKPPKKPAGRRRRTD
jgi:hypothetical protein